MFLSSFQIYIINDFVQNSTTLVTGEQAALRNITISNDGKKELAKYSDKLISVKSSDSSVISVKDGVLTAQAPGTATITTTSARHRNNSENRLQIKSLISSGLSAFLFGFVQITKL